ncbi:hypothetical protein Tsp_11864 [Trichinella spiralis]|uniref:hypothetical protein n=1 Tax=Trichinella spiralis TaxID=6334 RepID=UPI0001EFDB5B|nr:hypothetical protein Tsp_11864 [Trichinella spiralis]
MDEDPTLACRTEQWISSLENDQLSEVEASTSTESPIQKGNQHSPVTELAQHLAEHSLKLTPQKSLLSMDTAAYSPFPSTSQSIDFLLIWIFFSVHLTCSLFFTDLITETALKNSNDNFQLVLDSNENILFRTFPLHWPLVHIFYLQFILMAKIIFNIWSVGLVWLMFIALPTLKIR